jgi:lipoprotein-releasing system permease protein
VPFDTLQQLNNMQAEFDADDRKIMLAPACCNQIHIKVKGRPDEAELRRVAGKIHALWQEFAKDYADKPVMLAPAIGDVSVDTWRQRQMAVVGPIEQQRTLVVIIMAIMSIVAVALVFVILYTIVMQKTREIGVLKALGASSWGVAWLFFAYGAAIGLIGAVIGTVAGYYTTKNINTIQDWADTMFGLRVWTRKSFMFDKIPTEVDWHMACFIVAGAIAAGLVGALIPAIRAARMEPVEALRYE